jgi:hypothetical protein
VKPEELMTDQEQAADEPGQDGQPPDVTLSGGFTLRPVGSGNGGD